MNIRLFVATPLLLALAVPAQVAGQPVPKPQEPKAKPAAPAPAQKPPAPLPGDALTQPQEPAAPPKPKTAAEELAELKAEKARLEQEIGYVRERAQHATNLLARKLATRDQSFRAIDAGQSATARPMAMPAGERKYARIATPEEMNGRADGTIVVVAGREITEGAFEQVMNYLRQSPSAPDEALRAQRALFDLIRIEAVAGAFPESEGEVHVGEVLGELQGGADFAALAQKHGSMPGAQPDGSVEVLRNSIHGPMFETVAFTTEPGAATRPFRSANGYVLLRVDSIEKGSTPQLDKVLCHAIQIPYTSDSAALQKAQFAVNAGQVEVLVRDQATLDMLPALFKPPVVRPTMAPTANNREMLQQAIDRMSAQIDKLEKEPSDTTPDAIEALKKERARLQEMLKNLPDTPTKDVDADGDATPAGGAPAPAKPPVKPGGNANGG